MFSRIMVPVNLADPDAQEKALSVAADLARLYGAEPCYVGVTMSQPSTVARNTEEYETKLSAFAVAESEKRGIEGRHRSFVGHDLTTDVDDVLLRAVRELGADLVVMATHHPRASDHLWPSNGGKLASYADTSVLLVR